MTKALNLRRHSVGRIVAGRVSSTVVQNQFGLVLDRVAREGIVEITKHNRTYAVLLSVHAFQKLTMPSEPSMEQLAVEIGALLERMQTPEAKTAVDTLFAMGEAELGAAAVQQAQEARPVAPAPSRRVPLAKLLPSSGKRPKAGAAAQPAPRSGVARKRTRRRIG